MVKIHMELNSISPKEQPRRSLCAWSCQSRLAGTQAMATGTAWQQRCCHREEGFQNPGPKTSSLCLVQGGEQHQEAVLPMQSTEQNKILQGREKPPQNTMPPLSFLSALRLMSKYVSAENPVIYEKQMALLYHQYPALNRAGC